MVQDKRKPSYTVYENFRIPMGFPLDCFQSGLGYRPQPYDTFIVTYPKCGTTWTQHIIWMLQQQNGEPFPIEKNINLEVPHLEEVGAEFVAQLPSPRFIKTHFAFEFTPYSPDARYIYIARNPFDCVVSFYHHTKGFVRHYDFETGTFDEFFECFMAGEVDWGDYFDHLVGWYQQKDQDNVLFMTYEAMKKDPKQAVLMMAEFLGSIYVKALENQDLLVQIVYHTSFEQMRQNQVRWSSRRPDHVSPFIRKGQVGDWKNYFSSEQIIRLREKFKARTAGTDLELLWKNYGQPS